jgi:hypothetical protein
MATVDERIAKAREAAAAELAKLEAEKERLAKVAGLDKRLAECRQEKALKQDEIDLLKAERAALVPRRPRVDDSGEDHALAPKARPRKVQP